MTWKITGAPGTGDDLLYSQAGTPTLDLRFASSKSLNDNVSGQNLIDFTRGGNGVGTYVGSDGLIKNSVVNLLLRSEEFDNASWLKTRVTISPNSAVAPDGTVTADKLIDSTAGGSYAYQACNVENGKAYTLSVYAKQAEYTRATVQFFGGANVNGTTATFDLSNGTFVASVGDGANPLITPVGNGWYRVSFATTAIGTGSSNFGITLFSDVADGTSGIYIWGAQLEANTSTPGEYVKTTSSISGAPRFDHDPATGESLGLLIEESRANLLLNSATLATQDVTVTAVAHTLSFYGTGTVTLSGTHSATVVGTGAYPTRTTLTFTPTAGTLTVTVSGTVQYANLEIGSFATSWIPTAGTTVTRNADVAQITGSNFSRWYSQSQGAILWAGDTTALEQGFQFPYRITQGADLRGIGVSLDTRAGSDDASFSTRSDAGITSVSSSISYVLGRSLRIAGAYGSDVAASFSGQATVTATPAYVFGTENQLEIMGNKAVGGTNQQFNGHTRRLAYFDRRLPNAVLQAITAS